MAWNPKGGGPWGGGNGPWGGGGPSSSSPPPNIEELVRRTQDKMRRMVPGGMGTGRGILLLVLAAAVLWLATGFYRVQPGEQGVELLFGSYVKKTTPGLNYWPPSPIGEVITPNVEQTNQITIGFRGGGEGPRAAGARDVLNESLMLTADQNIIDIDFVVQWRIRSADVADFLFNIREPEATLKLAAESAIREVMGQTLLEEALTVKRGEVETRTRELLQAILDSYGAGINIAEVKLLKVDPPAEVIDAFNDVQRARQDQERSVNEATAYANDIVPRAKGEAQRIIQEAQAYRERLTAEAAGEAARFISVLEAYQQGRDLTTRRLYLERMQDVLRNSQNVVIDTGDGTQNVVPYLALPELQRKRQEAR